MEEVYNHVELSRKVEDYLEAIFNISGEKGYARIKDIALALGIKPPSVVEMIKKLDRLGFLIYRRYDNVTLTSKGKEIGGLVKGRHDTIKAFLEIIKVPEKISDENACTMEHKLDPRTLGQIKNLVEFVKTAPDYPEWLEHFEVFCKTGRHSCKKEKEG